MAPSHLLYSNLSRNKPTRYSVLYSHYLVRANDYILDNVIYIIPTEVNEGM